ncbi:MAG: HEAT repeat domain-containing protein [Anaerolineae bacterium]
MEAFRGAWPRFPAERRRTILRTLVEITEASFEADFNRIFRFCLSDEDEEVRAQAIEGLWEDESISTLRSLIGLLRRDPSFLVRAKAAAGLGRFVLLAELDELDSELGAEVREVLLHTINNPQEVLEVRRRAVEAISFSGEEEVRKMVEAAYQDEAQKMRVSAVFAMGRSVDPYWSQTLLRELKNPDPEMRYEAARACGELELKEAVPTLARLINDADREVQEAAIWALGRIGGRGARRVLRACCESDDEIVAEAVEEALSELEFAEGIFEIPLYGEEEE